VERGREGGRQNGSKFAGTVNSLQLGSMWHRKLAKREGGKEESRAWW
jgi:hypothetical protein